MMLRMKDDEGKGWAEIREAWTAMTGEKTGGSTLSGRYGRIKANFVTFDKEDVSFFNYLSSSPPPSSPPIAHC